MLRAKKGLERNTNRDAGAPLPPLEKILEKSGKKEQVNQMWTGQKINFGGKYMPRPPQKSRIAKEAMFNTGAKRIFDRHTGTGRSLNEKPKKSGAGGHNWGWPGIEIGVELASKDELKEIDREFNPTAPAPGEEPIPDEGDEEWAEEGDFYGSDLDAGLSGWEWQIAGEAHANSWPGYWEGLEGIRTLWGDELRSDEFTTSEALPHSTWQLGLDMAGSGFEEGTSGGAEEEEKRVALQVGGVPKWAEGVAWGDRRAERAAFEGVPVTPWGQEPERVNPETRGISGEGRTPASRALGLPEEGPLGLEAELMASGKKEEAPANFTNKDIKTEVKIDGRIAATIGEGVGGRQTAREVLEKMKDADKAQATRFDLGESVSLPSS